MLQRISDQNKLGIITGDKHASNFTTVHEMQMSTEKFLANDHLLSCIDHVLNLAARHGYAAVEKAPAFKAVTKS